LRSGGVSCASGRPRSPGGLPRGYPLGTAEHRGARDRGHGPSARAAWHGPVDCTPSGALPMTPDRRPDQEIVHADMLSPEYGGHVLVEANLVESQIRRGPCVYGLLI